MPLPIRARIEGLDATFASGLAIIEQATTAGMAEGGEGLLDELRDLTFKAGLGTRLPNTWKLELYPRGRTSLEPAAFVYSKAPKIISFFTVDRVITPLGAAFAIPVSPVIKRGGKPMSPVEVEARFNQELEARPLPSGNVGLFLDLVAAKSRRRPGFRPATRRRVAAGRRVEKTLMFVLVRSLRSVKLLDLEASAERWGFRTVTLIEKHFGRLSR
jgi:Family of unknown function (DUF6441)